MAIRMQQRRGTEEQWTLANPVLAAGEIGWASDVNKFKVGDGVNNWSDLSYFVSVDDLEVSIDDFVPLTSVGEPNGVASLDDNGKVPYSQIPNIDELSQDAIDSALIAGNGISKSYDDDANTITISADTDVLATKEYADGAASTAQSNAQNYADSLATNYDPAGAAAIAESNANSYTDSEINALSTDDIEQGNVNKYFSDTLARDAVSAGSGLDYNSTTGEFSADLGNGLQFDGTGQVEIDDNIVATNTSVSTAVSTHSDLTTGVHGVTGNVVGTDDVQTLENKALGSGTTLSVNLDAGGFTIIGLAEPSNAQDAATKAYVDAATAGLNVHDSVQAATTANIDLTLTGGAATVDGVSINNGNRVLVKNQTVPAENGVYVYNNGLLTRADDYNSIGEVDAGDFVFVEAGTVNGKTGWVQTNRITTLGTDAIEFAQFSGAGTYSAGTGLTLTGTAFAVNTDTIATKTYVDGELDAHIDLESGVHGVTGDVVGTTDTQTLSSKTLGTGTVLGANLDAANTYKVVNLQDPTSNQDAATKAYVDTEISNIDLSVKQDVVEGVSSTEISYLDGLTSNIQDQIDSLSSTSINTQTTSYTLQSSDANNIVEVNSVANVTITIPADSTVDFPIGTSVDIVNVNSGSVTISSEIPSSNTPAGQTSWTTLNSNFGTTRIKSIAYGNGIWVAGGFSGQMRTSTDGSTWTTVNSNFGSTNIDEVVFANNLWIAGGYSGQIRTSTDGSAWVTVTSNFGTTPIRGLAYGNGLWLAVGYNAFRTSTNGSVWTTITAPANIGTLSASYNNGIWVVGTNNGRVYRSTDTITWTTSTVSAFSSIKSIAYGNGIWVAGGGAMGALQIRSTDNAATWSQISYPGGDINEIIFVQDQNRWYAAGYYGDIYSSTDGSTWVTSRAAGGSSIEAIEGANSKLIAGTRNGSILLSDPLITQASPTILSKDSNTKITSQYAGATLYKRAANTWVAIGDLSA